MKNKIVLFIFIANFISSCNYAQKNIQNSTLEFLSKDGVTITADTYLIDNKEAPFILLFHQARFSRGEYVEIAPKLNYLGFNCIAFDQRSGKDVNDIINRTHLSAVSLNKNTKYQDAIPDLEAALLFVKETYNPSKIIIWGSSYSSSLVLYLASQHPKDISGVLSFSPGEYFTINEQKIENFVSEITCPVFITSAKDEQEYWQGIYDEINSAKTYFLPETDGKHGSKALWEKHEGFEAYWKAVIEFLQTLKN